MANIKSAKKRAKQPIRKAVQQGNKEAARELFRAAVPEIDSMVTKGIIKKNRAAQYKSRLNARVRALP
jgi:small subunit ribosomal protein S20